MKKILVTAAVLVLGAALTAIIWAGCAPGQQIWNPASGYQQALTNTGGALGTTLLIKFWEVGNATGANSGTMAYAPVPVTSYLTGYYLTTNWGQGGVIGCPLATGRTAFLYSEAYTVAGTGRYLIMSVAKQGAAWNFDTITNGPGNTPTSVRVPTETSRSSVVRALGYDFTANWTAMTAAALKGYYDSVPANNIITGVAVYYDTVDAVTPTIFTPYDDRGPNGTATLNTLTDAGKAWTPGAWVGRQLMVGGIPYPITANTATVITATGLPATGTVYYSISNSHWTLAYTAAAPARSGWENIGLAGTDLGTVTVFVPTATNYVSFSLLFDGALPGQFAETPFVGVPDRGPTAAGVFGPQHASLSGTDVTVAWQSNVESNVATYEIYWAAMQNGPFSLVSTPAISPRGNNSNYSVSFENPSTSPRGFYVKIRAVLMDGTYQDSQVMKVGGKPPTETQTPGSGNEK